jgi:2-dehydro-3-deoxy-D-gluconate 5-dehydrogenase
MSLEVIVKDLFSLEGKVAIITGGNGGIGKAIALTMASKGANIVIAARNQAKMAQATQEIQKAYKVKVVSIEADILQEDQIRAMVKEAAGALGKIDILVNNSGIADEKRPEDVTIAEWDLVINTNLRAPFLCSKAVYPYMKAAGGGKIINIGSMTSLFGGSVLTAYASSKGGVLQLTKSLACAWAGNNIQVNAILPGWYATNIGRSQEKELERHIASLTPMGRYGQVEELGGAAVFLASAASSFVTGIAIPVDGGYSAALRGLDTPFPLAEKPG